MPSGSSLPSRRTALSLLAGTGAALALGATAAHAGTAAPRPFGRYGSPARRPDPRTLYVDAHGRGDHTDVQSAVDAVTGPGHTLVIAPGVYRATVLIGPAHEGLTLIGASGDARDTVLVYDNAAGDAQARRLRNPGHQRIGLRHRPGGRVHRPRPDLRQRLAALRQPGVHRHAGRRHQGAGGPVGVLRLPLPRPPGHPVRRLPRRHLVRPPVLPRLPHGRGRRLRLRPRHRRLRPLPLPRARPHRPGLGPVRLRLRAEHRRSQSVRLPGPAFPGHEHRARRVLQTRPPVGALLGPHRAPHADGPRQPASARGSTRRSRTPPCPRVSRGWNSASPSTATPAPAPGSPSPRTGHSSVRPRPAPIPRPAG